MQQTLFMADTGQHPHMGFELQQPQSHKAEVVVVHTSKK
jgi:hypothetical protein